MACEVKMETATSINQATKNHLIAEGYDHPEVMNVVMKDGISLSVPTNINLLTPYVLLEQGDWFEEEIDFVRSVIQPGNHVVDIGAKYGAYSLSAAKAAGSDGKVWAFEPGPATAAYLSRSILLNQMNQVDVIAGCHAIPGGNTLILDDAMNRFGTTGIDFLKLDAEGLEQDILNHGTVFLSQHSPLIQYRIKYNEHVNTDLISFFASVGYDSYRLVPGIGCLVPCPTVQGIDPYQLNLFCCKADRALHLEKKGLLIRRELMNETFGQTDPSLWIKHIRPFPYAMQLAKLWRNYLAENHADPHWQAHQEALSCYALSRIPHIGMAERIEALNRAYLILKDTIDSHATFSRLMSFSRISMDLGFRAQAVVALDRLVQMMGSDHLISIDEPFIPVLPRFESQDPGEKIGAWILVSLLETRERYQSFSTYFSGNLSLKNLDLLKTLPFYHPDMEQRRKMIHLRRSFETPEEPAGINPGITQTHCHENFS